MIWNILRNYKLDLLILAIPFFIYYLIIDYFAVNIPYYDDFSVILEPLNTVAASTNFNWKVTLLFKANASHVPAITRILTYAQAIFMGGINFRYTIIAGNVGLLLTTLTLLFYFKKKYRLPWYSLLPIPFLLLSITHWEAMDFVTPAWQMYWGACLFPVLCFIAIVEGYVICAALAFIAALFLSSGGLCIYPLVIGFCLARKRWLHSIVFAATAGLGLIAFFHFLPASSGMTGMPDIRQMAAFIPAFMGNIVSNGVWDLQPYRWIHTSIGCMVLIAGIYVLWKFTDADLAKLVFIYVVFLAAMAIYARGVVYQYVPSRYAMFPALAIACLSCVYTARWLKASSPRASYKILVLALCSVLLWAHSIYKCIAPLDSNLHMRTSAMEKYLAGNTDALMYLLWSAEYGHTQLTDAKARGIYNVDVLRQEKQP